MARHPIDSRKSAGSRPMLIVTQVAPYTHGPAGVHGVLGQATTGLGQLAGMVGLEPVHVRDVAHLSPGELSNGGVLALFTIGETPFSEAQREAIVEGWQAGRLWVLGVHSATDACYEWSDYGSLLGARFDGHPWTQPFEIEVVDPQHPATAHLGERWSWHDEVYRFRDLRPDARVLLAVAEGQLDLSVDGGRRPGCGFPLSWCVADGRGRSFYSALGHFPGAWETPAYLTHLAGGLQWLCDGD